MSRFAIGIDLGGTQVRAALVDEQGNIHRRVEERTDAQAGPDRVLGQIRGLTEQLRSACEPSTIAGIGVSAPGPLDTELGLALDIPTLRGFSNYPLREELRKRLLLPVSLENDGIAAAVGEWQFGAGKGFQNLVYVTVSTGIGGGIIADGRVVRGRKGMAGHVGHMSIVPDGLICSCGGKGCFEAYASGTAFTKRARARIAECAETSLAGSGEGIDSRSVFIAAEKGDALATALVDEEAELLGRGFTSLIHMFSPEIVIMGGGLSQQFDRLQAGIQSHVERNAMPAFRDVRVVGAALGQNSGLIGAAALASFSRRPSSEL
ncbi:MULTISPECIES: ROK family protein [unclassified Rhizobium]|uniref:ROK family protein n=1 Tax=unclassified Rhizobium TaxID=2613769 RepID=UPI000646C5E7|nr:MULTISPECIES: ROK family protein [unclassified Rhizobium]MBN8954747.1 ROK family protein [Rhizobium tropici]OJY73409.1 MAG: glucokinase [Rhizobium sp. 60-20]RKD72395.1 glucokinase [Rhizobium sp. WW_1]